RFARPRRPDVVKARLLRLRELLLALFHRVPPGRPRDLLDAVLATLLRDAEMALRRRHAPIDPMLDPVPELRGRLREKDDGSLEPLRPVKRHQAHGRGPARLEAHLLDEVLVAKAVELAHERRKVASFGRELPRRGERLDEIAGAAVAEWLGGRRRDPSQ